MGRDRKDGFTSFGEFLKEVRQACHGYPRDPRLKTAGHASLCNDAQGGFQVPEEWADGIFNIVMEQAIVRKRAKVLDMARDSLKIRRLVESSRASSYFGGITFTWLKEAGDKTGVITKPTLGELELTAHKLVGGFYASNELMADYDKFGSFVQQAFGQALAFEEDNHFIHGSGAGQPLGIMNSGALISVTRTANGAVNALDIGNLAARLLPGSWNTAVWMMHPSVLAEWATLNAAAANVSAVVNLSEMSCFGRPIVMTEKCQAMGTTGDVILADWSHYVIGNRSLEISSSREIPGSYGFVTDETFWRVVLRVDGHPIMDAPITPKHGANTLSAFVVLTTNS